MSLQTDLAKKNEEIAAKQAAMAELFKGVTELSGQPAIDRTSAIKTANAELTDLGEKRDELDVLVGIEKSNTAAMKSSRQTVGRQAMPENEEPGEPGVPAVKSLRDILSGNEGFQSAIKSGRKFRGFLGEVGLKTLSTTADMSPQTQRVPLVLSAQEERTVGDMLLQGTTDAQAIEYYEETTFTNAAVEVAEGSPKPESAVDFTLVTATVRKIATWIPVTDEMLADNAGFESYLRERLGFMVKRREEAELLVGDGIAPNIKGIEVFSGVQTQAKGADPTPDALYKAISKIRNTGFAEPDGVVMHPNDWVDIRLLRTLDGIYIWGAPMDAGPERVWGLPVRITSAQTENTALVGAFRPHAQIFRKGGLELAVSDSHASYFISNLLAVRAEERLALAVYRPAAFCKVTGI